VASGAAPPFRARARRRNGVPPRHDVTARIRQPRARARPRPRRVAVAVAAERGSGSAGRRAAADQESHVYRRRRAHPRRGHRRERRRLQRRRQRAAPTVAVPARTRTGVAPPNRAGCGRAGEFVRRAEPVAVDVFHLCRAEPDIFVVGCVGRHVGDGDGRGRTGASPRDRHQRRRSSGIRRSTGGSSPPTRPEPRGLCQACSRRTPG
jgi:hypothetical protein